MANSVFSLEWDAPEHEHKERSADWFWAAGIVVFGIALTSIIFGNIIFAILVVVASFSLTLFINKKPDNLHIIINENGVRKSNTLYPMDTLASFWIDLSHAHKKIIIRSQKPLMPLIIIPLGEKVDLNRLREFLMSKMPEEELSLPLAEKILEYLGF